MTVDVSNVSSNSDNSDIIAFLGSVDNDIFFVNQFIGFIYSLVCAFWIVYVSCDLFTKMRKGRKLSNLTYFQTKSRVSKSYLHAQRDYPTQFYISFVPLF